MLRCSLALICGTAAAASAEETKVSALGLADHEVTQEELEKGEALPAPRFNTPGCSLCIGGQPQERRRGRDRAREWRQAAAAKHRDAGGGQGKLFAASGKARGPCRRLARGQLSRRAQDHSRRQAPDRAEHRRRSRSSRVGNGLDACPREMSVLEVGTARTRPCRTPTPRGGRRGRPARKPRSPRPSPRSGRYRRALPSGSACGRDRCRNGSRRRPVL